MHVHFWDYTAWASMEKPLKNSLRTSDIHSYSDRHSAIEKLQLGIKVQLVTFAQFC